MVSQDQKNDITEYDLDHLVQSSFNYGDDHLLEKMQKAEETISDDQIPPEPEDGFERLMAKMKKGGITAHSASDEDMESRRSAPAEEPEKRRKKRRLHTIIRIAIAAAIVGSVFTMTSVSVGAKKSYKYEVRSLEGKRNKVVINNENNKGDIGSLEDAYQKIHNHLGISVLKMNARPKTMHYLKTIFDDSKATMYFDIDGKTLIMVQQIKTTENSTTIVSDCEIVSNVNNEWLGQEIEIVKAVVVNGKEEYNTTITKDNGSYYLVSNINKEYFEQIVENLSFAEWRNDTND